MDVRCVAGIAACISARTRQVSLQPRTPEWTPCGSATAVVSGYATSWTSGNTSILTAQSRQIHGVNVGTTGHYAELTNIMYGPARDANPCPLQDVPVGGTGNVVQVQITAANITQNNITVVLSGPSGTTGNLNVQVTGPNGQSPVDPITNGNAGPGTYNYNFGLSNIPIGEYTTVTATWSVDGMTAKATLGYTFEVVGTYVQTQYNTPYEGNCGGTATNVTLWTASCSSSSASLLSNFINAVATPGSGTGSGSP
jgi:hypothetical protein